MEKIFILAGRQNENPAFGFCPWCVVLFQFVRKVGRRKEKNIHRVLAKEYTWENGSIVQI